MALVLAGVLATATAVAGETPGAREAPVPEAVLLDEVIVTARKREERLDDVPMSVQLLPGTLLDEMDASALYELQFAVPGLVANTLGMNGAGFALRGVSDQAGTGLSVAAHLDGTYLGSSHLAVTRMFDLERIEVLKGPQGTLYGRNATGGSLNFITRAPTDHFSAEVEAAWGSFATTRVQGHVNLPLDASAVRIAFIGSEGNGYIRNSVDDRRFAEEDFWGVRGAYRAQLGEAGRVDVVAQRVRDDGASSELWTPRPDFLPDPDDIRRTTVTLADPFLVIESDIASATVEYAFEAGTLRSITGYANSEVRGLDDCAGLPILRGCVRGLLPERYRQWSEELQWLWRGTQAVDALVGAYFFEADSTVDWLQHVPLLESFDQSHATSSESVRAVFGQATVHLGPRWNITAGARLSHEEIGGSRIETGAGSDPTRRAGATQSDDLSWRMDVDYTAAGHLLYYASVATGYKGAGFVGFIDGAPDMFAPEHLLAYEVGLKSHAFDRRLQLHAAAFYYDFEDLQVSTVTLVDGQVRLEVDNAARAELYGLDASASWRLSGRLAVDGGVVWMPKREYVEFRNDLTGDTLSGNDLVRAPEWSATAALRYEHAWGRHGTFSGCLQYDYRSGYFFTSENDPAFAQEAFGLLNLLLRFEAASGRWYAFATGRNLADQDYFNQVFLQSSPGYPRTFEIGAGYRF